MTVRHGVVSAASDPIDWPVIVYGFGAMAMALAAGLFFNYVFSWPFASTTIVASAGLLTAAGLAIAATGKDWHMAMRFGAGIDPQILLAMGMLLMAVLVFAAVAVAASTRLGQLMTLLVCLAMLVVGSVGDYLFGRHQDVLAARLLHAVFPNLTYLYGADAIMQGRAIPLEYAGWAVLYAVCEIVAILGIGVILFQTRELDSRGDASSSPRLVTALATLGRTAAVVLAALVFILPPRYPLASALGVGAGLAVLAAGLWILWGLFGRGAKWTWFFVLACFVLAGIGGGVLLVLPEERRPLSLGAPVLLAGAIAAAAIVGLLLLPKTRYHFGLRKSGNP
jgi:hypothetical protein